MYFLYFDTMSHACHLKSNTPEDNIASKTFVYTLTLLKIKPLVHFKLYWRFIVNSQHLNDV